MLNQGGSFSLKYPYTQVPGIALNKVTIITVVPLPIRAKRERGKPLLWPSPIEIAARHIPVPLNFSL